MSSGANQKVMSDEEKDILLESNKKNKENRANTRDEIKLRKNEIIENYVLNLPQELDTRMDNLSLALSEMGERDRLSIAEIKSYIESPRAMGGYSAEMLEIAFNYYKKMVVEINKVTKYAPTLKSFTAFLGVSTNTYNNWLVSDDNDKREICLMIDDYLTDSMLSQAQRREIDGIVTMYRTKSEHGMIEPTAPQVIKVESSLDINSILSNIESISGEKVVLDAEFTEKTK